MTTDNLRPSFFDAMASAIMSDARTARAVANEDAPTMPDLWAKNLLAEAELRNNVVRARNGDICNYTPAHIVDLMDAFAAGPEPDAETMVATEAGIDAALVRLGIVKP